MVVLALVGSGHVTEHCGLSIKQKGGEKKTNKKHNFYNINNKYVKNILTNLQDVSVKMFLVFFYQAVAFPPFYFTLVF